MQASSAAHPRLHVLLVGVDFLEHHPGHSLRGAHNDVSAWAGTLARLGVDRAEVLVSPRDGEAGWTPPIGGSFPLDGEPEVGRADLESVRAAFGRLAVSLGDGVPTSVVVLFSGHSSWFEAGDGQDGEMGLALRDARIGVRESHLRFSELADLLSPIAKQATDCWLLLDTCGQAEPTALTRSFALRSLSEPLSMSVQELVAPFRGPGELNADIFGKRKRMSPLVFDQDLLSELERREIMVARQYALIPSSVRVVQGCGIYDSSYEHAFQGRWLGCFTWAACSILERGAVRQNGPGRVLGLRVRSVEARVNALYKALAIPQAPWLSFDAEESAPMFGNQELGEDVFEPLKDNRQISGGTSGVRRFEFRTQAGVLAGSVWATAPHNVDSHVLVLPPPFYQPKNPTQGFFYDSNYWHVDTAVVQGEQSINLTWVEEKLFDQLVAPADLRPSTRYAFGDGSGISGALPGYVENRTFKWTRPNTSHVFVVRFDVVVGGVAGVLWLRPDTTPLFGKDDPLNGTITFQAATQADWAANGRHVIFERYYQV